MSKLLITLCLILSCALLFVNGQYTNCKDFGNSYKAEWTVGNGTLAARFTIPNSAGWAAVGFKNTGSGMTGSTILVGSKSSISGEYYANANSEPSQLSTNYFTSATSSVSGSTTTLTLVRPLTRPSASPSTYYTISSGTSMDILFAAHSSSAYPTQHSSTYKTTLNFFASSTCGTSTNSAGVLRQSLTLIVVIVLGVVGLLVC